MHSLEPSHFDEIKKTIQDEVLEKKWATKAGLTLKAKALSFKLRNVLTNISVAAKVTKARTASTRASMDVSRVTTTGGQMGSHLFGRGRERAVTMVPFQSQAASATPTPLSQALKKLVTK